MFGEQNKVVADYMDYYFKRSKNLKTFTEVMLTVSSVNLASIFVLLLWVWIPKQSSIQPSEEEGTRCCGNIWRTLKEIPHEMKMVAKLMQHSTL